MNPFSITTPRRSAGRPRVLLADEDLGRRYALAETLRSDGCEVHSASGHESWLSLFKSCLTEPAAWVSFVAAIDPDVVFLDIGQSGALATLGALRRHPLTVHVPVVVLGDEAHQRALSTALSLGAVRLIHRPLGLASLRPLVDTVIAESPPRASRTGDECAVLEVN